MYMYVLYIYIFKKCLEQLELSGYLRFSIAIGVPYIVASFVIALLQVIPINKFMYLCICMYV